MTRPHGSLSIALCSRLGHPSTSPEGSHCSGPRATTSIEGNDDGPTLRWWRGPAFSATRRLLPRPPNRAETDQRPVLTLWVPHRARPREAHGITDQWEAGTTPAEQTGPLVSWLLRVRPTRICLARCRSMTWGDSRVGDDEGRVSSLRVRRIRASRRTPGVPRCERTSPLHPLRFPEPTMGS